MPAFVRSMKWIMLLSGLLTVSMISAALTPGATVRSTFGEELSGTAATLVVRSWGILVALVGLMLVYGAFRPAARPLALVVAGASKLCFIALVLSHGSRFLAFQAGMAVAVDSVMVVLFAAYLAATRGAMPAARTDAPERRS